MLLYCKFNHINRSPFIHVLDKSIDKSVGVNSKNIVTGLVLGKCIFGEIVVFYFYGAHLNT